jgi:hypothetical protein
VAAGSPEHIASSKAHTGQHLRRILEATAAAAADE